MNKNIQERITKRLDELETALFRINGAGVVATLAFIGSQGKGFGYLAFFVVVIFLLGVAAGQMARWSSVVSLLEKQHQKHKKILKSFEVKFSHLTLAGDHLLTKEHEDLFREFKEFSKDDEGLDDAIDALEKHQKMVWLDEDTLMKVSMVCAGVGTGLGLIGLFQFA